jgi:hypothetical protein
MYFWASASGPRQEPTSTGVFSTPAKIAQRPEPLRPTQSANLNWTIFREALCVSEHVPSDVRLRLLRVLLHLGKCRRKYRPAAVFSRGLRIRPTAKNLFSLLSLMRHKVRSTESSSFSFRRRCRKNTFERKICQPVKASILNLILLFQAKNLGIFAKTVIIRYWHLADIPHPPINVQAARKNLDRLSISPCVGGSACRSGLLISAR